jgi:hypothetical protein
MNETDATMPLLVLTAKNRTALTRKTLISLGLRRQRHGPYRILPYALPMLAISKLLDGGLQNIVDVSYLLGVADDGELEVVRSLVAGDGPELLDDIENLIAIGQFEAEMRTRR